LMVGDEVGLILEVSDDIDSVSRGGGPFFLCDSLSG